MEISEGKRYTKEKSDIMKWSDDESNGIEAETTQISVGGKEISERYI